MTLLAYPLLAALAVAPADRLLMADRQFNRGEYESARAEYSALEGEGSVPADELLYRLAECDRALGDKAAAREKYSKLVDGFPASKYTDRALLMKALSGGDDERRSELKMLDSDRVENSVRSAALYYLGSAENDPELLARCIKADPKGKYASYANFHRASILVKSEDPAERRKAVEILLSIAFGGEKLFAEEALYLAAAQSYAEKRYGEAASVFRRYLKTYPQGKHAADVRTMAAWSEYLAGRYSDCAALCGDGASDDFAYLLAACAFANGDKALAKTLFGRYLEEYPGGKYRANAELPLSRMGFDDAEKEDDKALIVENAKRAYAISNLSGDALRLAWAYEKCSMENEAIAQYVEVAQKFPGGDDAAEAMFRKAMIDARARRWDAVELSLAEALATGKNGRRRAESLYWRGVAAFQLDHQAEGVAFLSEALQGGLTMDQKREAWLMIADVLYRDGKIDRAKETYAKLVREGACDRMNASKILAVGKMMDVDEARICANRLAASDSPEWRQAGYALMGATEEKAGVYSVAIEAYRKCLAEDAFTEDLPGAALSLGVLEYQSGEFDAAEKTLRRAVDLNASSPAARELAYVNLAKTCEAKGNAKDAVAYATVVVSLFPESELTAEAAKIIAAHPEAGND
ncbi:MAG: tetratricopeptide repeat protein [Kiritimatiellae bacterium]|nr:tetratricopeptide repeat protein [Kiritimatiellia bacterium]